jgi:tellurite resistance protein
MWIQYVEQKKRNENNAFALIQAAVAVFAAADGGAAVRREPLHR